MIIILVTLTISLLDSNLQYRVTKMHSTIQRVKSSLYREAKYHSNSSDAVDFSSKILLQQVSRARNSTSSAADRVKCRSPLGDPQFCTCGFALQELERTFQPLLQDAFQLRVWIRHNRLRRPTRRVELISMRDKLIEEFATQETARCQIESTKHTRSKLVALRGFDRS